MLPPMSIEPSTSDSTSNTYVITFYQFQLNLSDQYKKTDLLIKYRTLIKPYNFNF